MNTVLDTLFLRTPRIEYVCPPVCETIFSGSGHAVIILEPIGGNNSPTGLIKRGVGHSWLTWNTYPGALCYTIYFQPTVGDQFAIISECVPPGTIALCKLGYYKFDAVLADGSTTPLSDAFHADGVNYSYWTIDQFPTGTQINLYRSDTIDGTYTLELVSNTGLMFQTCHDGCYAVSAITLDGETPLSAPACNCVPLTLCEDGFGFNELMCECVPCTYPDLPCDNGFAWDATQCKCIPAGPPGPPFEFNMCKDVADGFTFDAPGTFAAPCTFSLVGPLPAGIVFTQDTPLSASIHGTPTEYGTFNFVVEITDATDQFQELSYRLFVEGINSTSPPPTPEIGVPYSFTWTATGGTPPYFWQIEYLSPHPFGIPGLTFDASTATLSGTATTPGTYNFNVIECDKDNNCWTSCDACEPHCTWVINSCPNWNSLTPGWFTLASGADGGGTFGFSQVTPNQQFVFANIPNPFTSDAQIERQSSVVVGGSGTCNINVHIVLHKQGDIPTLCGGVAIFNPGPGGPAFSFNWDPSAHAAGTYDVPLTLPANGGVPYTLIVDVGVIAGGVCAAPSVATQTEIELEATFTNV
jgi:hypothetical protein